MFEKMKEAISNLFASSKNIKPPKTTDDVYNDDNGMSTYNQWQGFLQEQLSRNASDKIKYKDYDMMDNEIPEITAALNVTADYVVYPSSENKTNFVRIFSGISEVSKKIEEILNRINFKTEFYFILREALKYGDDSEEILLNKTGNQIMGLKFIPVESVLFNMQNGIMQDNPMIIQVNSGGETVANLKSSEAMHLSINSDRQRYIQFGKGVSSLEKSRLVYRQLRLMEEGVIIRRLSRSNQSYGIVVDVGDYQGEDALNYLDSYRKRISRKKYINPSTGRITWKYNPLSILEDILIPTRQGSGGTIIPLNNSSVADPIDDINYFQNKLIYSTGVPKILIGKEEDLNSKSSGDIQFTSFLRNIRRIQLIIEPEIKRFITLALRIEGVNLPELDIRVEWPLIGTIDEERAWRIKELQARVATILYRDLTVVDENYVLENLLGFTIDQAIAMQAALNKRNKEANAEMDAKVSDAENLSGTQGDLEDLTDMEDEEEEEPEDEETAKETAELKKSFLASKQFRDSTFNRMLPDKQFKKLVTEFVELELAKRGQ